jgi:beta-lactamase regulating signal transducer with metallopeptidase domain/protocatechuate 3,4-dioxygenase beta subunit
MNPFSEPSWSATTLAFGLGVAAKATVILMIVFMIQNLLMRRRAFLGSAVVNAGLIGLLLLPVVALIFPSVPITCLPAQGAVSRSVVAAAPDAPSAASWTHNPAEDVFPISPKPVDVADVSQPVSKLVRADDSPRVASAPVMLADGPSAGSTRSRDIDWAALAILGYTIGVIVLIARLGTSMLAVARLRQSCAKVDDTQWIKSLERWRAKLEIGRTVDLAWSPAVSVPVALGWLHPMIVLPSSLIGKSWREHSDAVLLHELSHVRRGDYLWNLCLRFVLALYWPHVLVWLLGRASATLREKACDDLCVHEMGGPSVYREALLAVAADKVRRPSPALGLAMAHPSKLGRRLARIEQSNGHEICVPCRPVRLTIAALAITLAGLIGSIHVVRAQAPAAKREVPPVAVDAGRVFHLQVVAADTGAPVADADVRLWIGFRHEWRKTDANGRLEINHSTGPSDQNFGVDVWGKGRAMQRHNWGRDANKPIPEGETIRLQSGESLGGLVKDEAGRPIAGATILLWSHNFKKKDRHELLYDLRAITGRDGRWHTSGAPETTGELLGFRIIHPDFLSSRDYYDQKGIMPKIGDLRAEKALTVMKKGVPIEGRVVDADGKPVAGARVLSTYRQDAMFTDVDKFAVSTDSDGRFRTGQVRPGQWFLVASAKGHAPADQRVKVGTAVQQVEVSLGRPRPFKGRVVDPNGKPIAGAFVDPDLWRGYRCLGAFLWTDAEGRFRWDDAPRDDLLVNVSQQGYRGLSQQRVSPSGEDVVFALEPSLRILGKVRNAETQARVENATVEYSAVDPMTGETSSWTRMPELGASTGIYLGNLDINFPVTADAYKFRVRSPGYQPLVSRTFKREEKVVSGYDISLMPGTEKPTGAVATVLRPNGKPLVGARLLEIQHGGSVSIQDGVANVAQGSLCREGRTGPDGVFSIPQYKEPWLVFILGDDSYAVADEKSLQQSPKVEAKPYARIEGQCRIGSQPVPNRELTLSGMIGHVDGASNIFLEQKTTTDSDGRFTFQNVVPASSVRIARRDPNERRGVWSLGEPVHVEPGKTTQALIGGKGRPVIGRVEPPSGWTMPIDFHDHSEAHIDSNRPLIPYPFSLFRGKTMQDGLAWFDWQQRWHQTPEGHDYMNRRVSLGVALAPDGSFRIDDVRPGEYRLAIRVNGESIHHVSVMMRRNSGPFSHILRVFTVPPVPGGLNDEPLDLGALPLQPRRTLAVGEPAPAFELTTVDGKKLAVPGDFRGKFLLVDFGTLWDIAAPTQIATLNEVNQKFGKVPHFAMLSLTFEADTADTRKSIADKGEPWPQAITGPLSNPIASAYGIDDENVSTPILIGPDGKIAAKDLWRDNLGKALDEVFGRADR